MSEQEALWAGEFGNSYTERNRVDWSQRVPFWDDVISWLAPQSVLEVGCNAGWNLEAIKSLEPGYKLAGLEINETAADQARAKGFNVKSGSIKDLPGMGKFELVFTAGVLIHVPPADLEASMKAIRDASSHYIVAVEYEDDTEVEVTYRGHGDRLWRRPYGDLYQDIGMRLIETGDAEGFDACRHWILERK